MFRPKLLIGSVAFAAALAGAAAAQPAMSARDFAQAAAQSDNFEIQAGRVAVAESRDPRVQAFARQMIEDHSRSREALRQAAAAAGLPPLPTSMSGDQARLLSALQSQSGPAFDRTYARQQAIAHQGALTTEQGYAAQGSDPNLRQSAHSAVPLIQHHLEMAQQMKAALAGS
jgi:putative membrane protein